MRFQKSGAADSMMLLQTVKVEFYAGLCMPVMVMEVSTGLDTSGEYTLLLENIQCSNGMGFSKDKRTLYHTDSLKKTIYCFDYSEETGEIHNQRVFTRVRDKVGEGIPDGLTVDSEDCIWSARWGGSCVVRYSPKGNELSRIQFPAGRVSSLTFGGKDYGDLYVTTAGGDNKEQHGEGAGAVFRVRAGCKRKARILVKDLLLTWISNRHEETLRLGYSVKKTWAKRH